MFDAPAFSPESAGAFFVVAELATFGPGSLQVHPITARRQSAHHHARPSGSRGWRHFGQFGDPSGVMSSTCPQQGSNLRPTD